LEQKSSIDILTSKIKLDVFAQRTKYFNMVDLETNYDVQFDEKEGYVNVSD